MNTSPKIVHVAASVQKEELIALHYFYFSRQVSGKVDAIAYKPPEMTASQRDASIRYDALFDGAAMGMFYDDCAECVYPNKAGAWRASLERKNRV